MGDLLSIIWFMAAGGGAVAVLGAFSVRRWRRFFLVVAAYLFGVAGVLGIFSIGLLFLILAVACAVGAVRTVEPPPPTPRTEQEPTV